MPQAQAAFEIHNSPLSENAAIGFEFGYNMQEPSRLVIWEAQYGDFINGAQMMIDEFIDVGARQVGADAVAGAAAAARLRRRRGPTTRARAPSASCSSAADINMRVANCTTAAQYFHLLRRQAALLDIDPLPLVVLTPKSLLRHPLVASTPRELAEGRFQAVIDDAEALRRAAEVRRVVLCSGKVYVDLVASEKRALRPDVAVVRLEQLYPFPPTSCARCSTPTRGAEDIVWLQEEPENMGAWDFVRPLLVDAAGNRRLRCVARPRSASPAEGSAARHALNQQALVDAGLRGSGRAPRRRAGRGEGEAGRRAHQLQGIGAGSWKLE